MSQSSNSSNSSPHPPPYPPYQYNSSGQPIMSPYPQRPQQFAQFPQQQQQYYTVAQQHQQIHQPTWQDIAWRRAKMAGFGFMMGAVVGGSVVGLHGVINRLPRQMIFRSMAGTGAAFGTIFAVGTLIKPA